MNTEAELWRERIHANPEIMDGHSVVRGTRVTAGFILTLLVDRPDADEAAAEFHNVDRTDVLAAVGFAAHVLRENPEAARRLAATADKRIGTRFLYRLASNKRTHKDDDA